MFLTELKKEDHDYEEIKQQINPVEIFQIYNLINDFSTEVSISPLEYASCFSTCLWRYLAQNLATTLPEMNKVKTSKVNIYIYIYILSNDWYTPPCPSYTPKKEVEWSRSGSAAC